MEIKNIRTKTGIKDDIFGMLLNQKIYQVEWCEHFQKLLEMNLIETTEQPASVSWEKMQENAIQDIKKYYSKQSKIKTAFAKMQASNQEEQDVVIGVIKEKLDNELNSVLNQIKNNSVNDEDITEVTKEEIIEKIDELDSLFEQSEPKVKEDKKSNNKRGK